MENRQLIFHNFAVMKKIYLDNASTTAIRPEVIQEMTKVMAEDFGNPSSTHSFGRNAKSVLELSRKSIAKQLNASAQEIIFTSCGTEANNWILRSAVADLKVKRIITSKIEHHAVLYTVQALQIEFGIQVDYVAVKPNGEIDITHLVELLAQNHKTLVSLMHVNNEIGTVLDLNRVVPICKQYNALLHSDTVQSIGKKEIDLQELPIDFLVASAHKFHGPKGTQISDLKKYLIERLEIDLPLFTMNGSQDGFYNMLNVLLPFPEDKTAMILFNLDMKGIAVSRGSACQSGSIRASHVLAEILSDEDLRKPSLRISFSHNNSKEDIDLLMDALKSI